MLTKELQTTIHRAIEEAAKRRHEYVTLEHLLYALLAEKTASTVIQHCGGDLAVLKRELEQSMTERLEALPRGIKHTPGHTTVFERVLERAVLQAQASRQATIDGGNILAAMFQEQRSYAVYLLQQQGIDRLDVLNYISHGISKLDTDDEAAVPVSSDDDAEDAAPQGVIRSVRSR